MHSRAARREGPDFEDVDAARAADFLYDDHGLPA
jgi:hypothetical protein